MLQKDVVWTKPSDFPNLLLKPYKVDLVTKPDQISCLTQLFFDALSYPIWLHFGLRHKMF